MLVYFSNAVSLISIKKSYSKIIESRTSAKTVWNRTPGLVGEKQLWSIISTRGMALSSVKTGDVDAELGSDAWWRSWTTGLRDTRPPFKSWFCYLFSVGGFTNRSSLLSSLKTEWAEVSRWGYWKHFVNFKRWPKWKIQLVMIAYSSNKMNNLISQAGIHHKSLWERYCGHSGVRQVPV